jgi:hypothetical protein
MCTSQSFQYRQKYSVIHDSFNNNNDNDNNTTTTTTTNNNNNNNNNSNEIAIHTLVTT